MNDLIQVEIGEWRAGQANRHTLIPIFSFSVGLDPVGPGRV